jgi:hypothetical protein
LNISKDILRTQRQSRNSLSGNYGNHRGSRWQSSLHSFKFAELQEKQKRNNPTLIRIDVKQVMVQGNQWRRAFRRM